MWCRSIDVPDMAALAAHFADGRGLTWLDSATPGHRFGRYSYLCIDPVLRLSGSDSLDALRQALAACSVGRTSDGPPFQGGLVGFFGYEFGARLVETDGPPVPESEADHSFALYDTLIAVDHLQDRAWILSAGLSGADLLPDETTALSRLNTIAQDISSIRPLSPVGIQLDWVATASKAAHIANVKTTKAYIAAGDIYQANIAQTFLANIPDPVSPLAIYLSIRASNPAPFSAFTSHRDHAIACTSPERLVYANADGDVEARPIKGTIKQSPDPGTDEFLRHQLETSEKDRAENIMIVDLLRNDLSRVCQPHSVKVPELCTLETYAGLHQLTSSVKGVLAPELDAFDLVAAVFPGGSVTGAPKARAMEIIRELEARPRGAFCGAFGYFGFDGACDLNIMIRTVEIQEDQARLEVGGGITHLSDPEAEYQETLLKADRIMAGTTQTAPLPCF